MRKEISINLNINSPEEIDIDTLSQTMARQLKELANKMNAKSSGTSEEGKEQYNRMRRALDLKIGVSDVKCRKVVKAILKELKENEVTVHDTSDILHDAYILLLHNAKL